MKKVLAFDFGASSGRAMLGIYENDTIKLEEIHRFTNDPVTLNGVIYWDVLRLFHEIKQGIIKAKEKGSFDCIGIDTWGVDFGLIDEKGNLLSNPINYRDEYTLGVMEDAFKVIDKSKLYEKTGIQFMRFNTIFQLIAYAQKKTNVLSEAKTLLLIPDLFNYFLTGEKRAEYTQATTTQLINPYTLDWDLDLCKLLDIKTAILPKIIMPGETYGVLSDEIASELNCEKVPVISVASHDTASAIVATPSLEDDFIYISCGTWSLFGTQTDKPFINEQTYKYNLTNEGGYDNKITLLKNIMGLWLIQQSKKHWENNGENVTYASLEQDALKEKAFACFIDVDDEAFTTPGDMPKRVMEYCKNTNQYVPKTKGEIMRCIYESLALKYRLAYDMIKDTTKKEYNNIHMIGGGTKDSFLCQLTANACNTFVQAGPIEATVTGNIAVCLTNLGAIKDLNHARQIIKNSTTPIHYTPSEVDEWEIAYKKYKEILKL